jgi:SpoVK/Ycf46/Vps4 family AAA+-type ATPase
MKPVRRLLQTLERDVEVTVNWHKPASATDIPTPEKITGRDFAEALQNTKPSPSQHLDKYEQWYREFGSV